MELYLDNSVNSSIDWPFGKENWCNMEGQYVHMVADMSEHIRTARSDEKVSVCGVGVYGTKYVREASVPVPSTITIGKGQTETLEIANIVSEFDIGNRLVISLR